ERMAIREAIDAASGTNAELARRLGITRRTLYNKFRRYGLSGGDRS
ncbi:MAG TPA: helix-turn-helix domain-containing protein, partial [Phycisphaerae bacterium]|nr:helix-turn-helix domain-containing protein [Phycisphaerae bacterium]